MREKSIESAAHSALLYGVLHMKIICIYLRLGMSSVNIEHLFIQIIFLGTPLKLDMVMRDFRAVINNPIPVRYRTVHAGYIVT